MKSLFTSPAVEVLLRLIFATVAGGALGLNRELRDKPAGMRTHALVALGAALAAMLCVPPEVGETSHNLDALSRVIQGVLTGIGFLGGGVILRDSTHQRVQGLTTAATIWVTASLGVACGAGYWLPVLVAAGLTLVVLVLGGPVEKWLDNRFHRDGNGDVSE